MGDVRDAGSDDIELVARIAARGFYDDPVMTWVVPDDSQRLALLELAFAGLARDYIPDRGVVHLLDDACVTYWRTPSYDHAGAHDAPDTDTTAAPDDRPAVPPADSPFPPDVIERFVILDDVMAANHPHEPHWYLNVIATDPDRQGQGLGAALLQPVVAICDRDGSPAYLESSNPRNMTLYRRHGFEETGEIALPDGPLMYPMWREPR